MKKNLLILIAIVLSVFLCEKPNFHPEAMFHSPYHWWLDMVFHGGYYFAITVLLYPLVKGEEGKEGKRGRGEMGRGERGERFNWIYFIVILILSYALEADQLIVPGRSFSILDLTSNTLGISLAAGVSFVLFHRSLNVQ